MEGLVQTFTRVVLDVLIALGPGAVFLLLVLRFLPEDSRVFIGLLLRGVGLALVGFTLFLTGVEYGFLPAARETARVIAAEKATWILVVSASVIGLTIVLAEPGVRIFGRQVEESSGGYLTERIVVAAIGLGVAVAVAVTMLRITYDIPLMYILVPGWVLALSLLAVVPQSFVGIAFDAGGSAVGPLSATLLVAFTLGVAEGIPGRDPLQDGFGLVGAMVLTSTLSLMSVGLGYRRRENR